MVSYDYQGMRDAGARIEGYANDLSTLATNINTAITNLGDSWQDAAQQKFVGEWETLYKKIMEMVPHVDDFGKAAKHHAQSAEDMGSVI